MTKKKVKKVIDYKALYESEQRQSDYYLEGKNRATSDLAKEKALRETTEKKLWETEDRARRAIDALDNMKYDVIRWLINPNTVPGGDDKKDGMDFGGLRIQGLRLK